MQLIRTLLVIITALLLAGACTDDNLRRLTDVDFDSGEVNTPPTEVQSGKARLEKFTQIFAAPKHDILWVIDNSGSMSQEIQYVKANVEKFAARMWQRRRTVDFQMSLAVTDYLAYRGQLQKILRNGQEKYAIPGNTSDFVTDMTALLNTIPFSAGPTEGYEMGLITAKAAIEKYSDKFMRDDAALHVVTISDEEDWSCDPNDVPAGKFCAKHSTSSARPDSITNWHRIAPEQFVDFFKNVGRELFFFPVVGIVKANCKNVSTLGTRYAAVQQGLPNGKTLDICENVIEENLDQVAAAIGDLGSCFKLKDPRDPTAAMVVKVNGQTVRSGFEYDGALNQVCFVEAAIPANGAVVEISYQTL